MPAEALWNLLPQSKKRIFIPTPDGCQEGTKRQIFLSGTLSTQLRAKISQILHCKVTKCRLCWWWIGNSFWQWSRLQSKWFCVNRSGSTIIHVCRFGIAVWMVILKVGCCAKSLFVHLSRNDSALIQPFKHRRSIPNQTIVSHLWWLDGWFNVHLTTHYRLVAWPFGCWQPSESPVYQKTASHLRALVRLQ